MLHIPGLGFDGLVGYSPIAMAKNAIGIALATEEYGAAFFKNGARPGGVLEHPGVLKDPSKLRESWHAVYGGTMNTGRIAVLEEGVKYQQIAIPPEKAQFLETRKFQIDEIARLYRVPPHMDAETWMNAKKAVELGFADTSLNGEKNRPTSDEADGLIFSRAAVTNSLLSKFGQGNQMNNVDAESLKRRLFSIAH